MSGRNRSTFLASLRVKLVNRRRGTSDPVLRSPLPSPLLVWLSTLASRSEASRNEACSPPMNWMRSFCPVPPLARGLHFCRTSGFDDCSSQEFLSVRICRNLLIERDLGVPSGETNTNSFVDTTCIACNRTDGQLELEISALCSSSFFFASVFLSKKSAHRSHQII